jgi:EEF1A N-terminal glycine/lysine methyltransferase
LLIKFYFAFNNISQLETALSTDRRGTKWKTRSSQESGEEELSEVGSNRSNRSKPSRSRRHHSKPRSNARTRSGTASSTQTNTATVHAEDTVRTTSPHKNHSSLPVEPDTKTPTRTSFVVSQDEHRESEPVPSLPISKTDTQANVPSVARPTTGVTDDSDNDFQSAYSASPRDSYGDFDSEQGNFDIVNNDTLVLSQENVEDRLSAAPKTRRERVESTSTAIIIRESTEPRSNLTASRSRVTSKV